MLIQNNISIFVALKLQFCIQYLTKTHNDEQRITHTMPNKN